MQGIFRLILALIVAMVVSFSPPRSISLKVDMRMSRAISALPMELGLIFTSMRIRFGLPLWRPLWIRSLTVSMAELRGRYVYLVSSRRE